MIKWEELNDIHVIRKLKEVLGQWFDTDIFFVDERGTVRNYDSNDRNLELRNPLSSAFLGKERGRLLLLKAMSDASEKGFKAEQPYQVLVGPAGVETMVVSRIVAEHEFLGSVVAYSYADQELSSDVKGRCKTAMDALGLESDEIVTAASKLKVLNANEQKYFHELVNLVSQEIVTFYTEITKREERINALNNQLGNRYSYDQMIGKSKAMQEIYGLLDKIRNSESTVLIQGENGTGKELIARSIHFNSPRKEGQFVIVNCSAFNENLLDSELFGHVRGAFTGAIKDKKGLFEIADRGTLFLDELGDMPLSMQVKLLRVLQQGTFIPVGGTVQKKVDVRVVAATNKDLKEMVEEGSFREDLYYRINVINLMVPPLRNRKEDIPILVDHFLAEGCKEKNLPLKTFAKRTLEKIFDYPWPGNIRELANEIERLIVLSGTEEKVSPELLSPRIRDFGEGAKSQLRVAGKLKDAIEELEKTMIREGLRRTNWNKSRLAKELGISRASLIMKVEKYNLERRRLPRPESTEAA